MISITSVSHIRGRRAFRRRRRTVPEFRLFRDRDAFEGTRLGPGILDLIRDTSEFDTVLFADEWAVAPSTAGDRRLALVVPGWATNRPQPSPGRRLRVVQYHIRVTLDLPEGPDCEREFGRIFSVLFNALDGVSYGGFCMFDWSRLERDDADNRPNPGGFLQVVGQFAYVTSRRSGGLSVDP